MPTAQTLLADKAVTAFNVPWACEAPATTFHLVPSQCSISGLKGALLPLSPTAQTLLLLTAATPMSSPTNLTDRRTS